MGCTDFAHTAPTSANHQLDRGPPESGPAEALGPGRASGDVTTRDLTPSYDPPTRRTGAGARDERVGLRPGARGRAREDSHGHRRDRHPLPRADRERAPGRIRET